MQQKDILKNFGNRLRTLRLLKGYSQEQLSAFADIDRTYISDVERGLRNIALENIQALADALHVPTYQFFITDENLLHKWDISLAELEDLITQNPSLRGFIIGYLAEAKLRAILANDKRILSLKKFDDHDRKNKHDLVVNYKHIDISFEIKSLQTNTVKSANPKIYPNAQLEARLQCDASDKRTITLSNGETVSTTCLRFGDFDILAVNMFAFHHKWNFAFALNQHLPHSDYKKYPEEVRKSLIKSLIPITLPLQHPFVLDPFELLEQIYQARVHS
jgi:transcriptional regulator with XRE-family HTH domain